MTDTIRQATVWPVNNLGEIVVQNGAGGSTVLDSLSKEFVPVDASSGKLILKLPVQNPRYIDVRDKGVTMDGKAVHDASVTGSSAASMNVYSTSALFTAADVGKKCAHIPKTEDGHYTRFGSITAFIDSQNVTVSLSGITAVTAQTFVWGTDSTAALNTALASAGSAKAPCYIPSGICVCTDTVIVPTGVTMFGDGNHTFVSFARDFEYYNSCLVLVSYISSGSGFVQLGNNGLGNNGTSSGTRGTNLMNLNVDAMGLADEAAVGPDTGTNAGRGNHIHKCTIIRGGSEALWSGASSVVDGCTIVQQQRGRVVFQGGDARLTNNFIFGAGATFPAIEAGAGDLLIQGNHIWKDAGTPSATGGAVHITVYGGVTSMSSKGSIIVSNNQFDTSFGAHVTIDVAANTFVRAVNISDNLGFQNDDVPNATYPCISLIVASGGSIRALSIMGNVFQGSWYDNTKGQYTCLIDGTGIVGTVRASTVVGNTADNCAALYTSFTPTYTAGNHVIPGAVLTTIITG